MKKILFSIAALAVAFSFTACSNEDEALESGNKGTITVTAFTESNTTRSALAADGEGAYNVVWSSGDQLFDRENEVSYTLISSSGSTTAEFKGPAAPKGSTVVLLHGVSYDALESPSWPTDQKYKENNVSVFPMRAVATSDADGNLPPLQFKNLGGVLCLNVKGTATIKDITVSANECMSGYFDGFNDKTVDICPVNFGDLGEKFIKLNCGSGVELNNTNGVDFYFAIPANTYTGVIIKLTDTNGNYFIKKFKGTGLVIERSKMTKASFTEGNFVPVDALPSGFSVSDTKKVYFSKGNLYYDGEGKNFKLFDEQYTTSYSSYPNLATFFWSANAANAYDSSCDIEKANKGDVIFTNETETTPNPSFTVNGQTGVWRTLSADEWGYLFSHYTYTYAYVYGRPGVVIAPTGVTTIEDYYRDNAWAAAEANGYVFLPNTGFRNQSTSISETGKSCIYWSSTLCKDGDNTNKPYREFFQWHDDTEMLDTHINIDSPCYWGVGIRLVQDVK